ncbi:MAG: Holliday junction resolvase RuvX [Ureaplasma sp.]|nr:Holliday junction resolvase RuvX [Ureaplasma sp.]
MRIISLDLGTKTCGFAITDENRKIANPLENYSYSKNDFKSLINRINYWFNVYENNIDLIVLGYPTNTIGNQTQMTEYVERFYEILSSSINNIKIVKFDERFSTQIGSEWLMDLGIKASQRKKIKDKMAACVILNNYLESIK